MSDARRKTPIDDADNEAATALQDEKDAQIVELQDQLTDVKAALESLQEAYEENLSKQITSFSSYTNDPEELGYIVTADSCSAFPYLDYPYLEYTDNFYKGCLFHVDMRYLVETADGESEYWLLLSQFDNGQLGKYQYYLETRLNQVWIRQADTEPYTEEIQSELVYPVWVDEGTTDIDGVLVRTSMNPFSVQAIEDGNIQIVTNGGTMHWVASEDITYPDLDTYGYSYFDQSE